MDTSAPMTLCNPFALPGQWLKANLHTHTTVSDGDTAPAERVQQYRDAGYDVLAISDHHRVVPIDDLARPGLVLLQSVEVHPPCPGGPLYHLVCLNVPEGFTCGKDETAQSVVQRVRAAGGEVVLAHPYWCGRTVDQILAIDDLIAIEVYNNTCGRIGKADSSVVWDYVLATGRMLPATGVDDVHAGGDLFGSWTMIRAREATSEAVMDALRQGAFYASCGPEITDFGYTNGAYFLHCSPVVEICFIGRGSQGRCLRAAGEGDLLQEALWTADPGLPYVRAMVTDVDGKRAWTPPLGQPILARTIHASPVRTTQPGPAS